jgi:hypothetical protein
MHNVTARRRAAEVHGFLSAPLVIVEHADEQGDLFP